MSAPQIAELQSQIANGMDAWHAASEDRLAAIIAVLRGPNPADGAMELAKLLDDGYQLGFINGVKAFGAGITGVKPQ